VDEFNFIIIILVDRSYRFMRWVNNLQSFQISPREPGPCTCHSH